MHGRGQNLDGGTSKRFLSVARSSHFVFFHTTISVEHEQDLYILTYWWCKVSKTYKGLHGNKLKNLTGDVFFQLVKLQWL